jgi:hypothetical protein
MNTTRGTNTNPTAVALARIVWHTERMYNNARTTTATETIQRDAYHWIMEAVADIATRNGNDPADILEHAPEILNLP